MKRSGGTGTHIDWTAGDPEAEAALNRCLRLASAREAGVRDEELTRVLRELMGGAVLPEEAWERLARLLDLFGVIRALHAMRLAAFRHGVLDPVTASIAAQGPTRSLR